MPPLIAKQLPLKENPRLRIEGEINEEPFIGAWQPVRGRWYLMLNKKLIKSINANIGEIVNVEFRLSGQDEVQVPIELLNAIKEDNDLWIHWKKLSAGVKRALSYMVLNAKNEPNKTKRINVVLDFLSKRQSSISALMKPKRKIKK